MKVIVVGAGILGACLSYELAKKGAQVCLIDPAPPGGIATRHSFGWVNANYPDDPAYFDLRVRGMAAYGELIQELDLRACSRWHGSLVWEDSAEDLRAQVATLAEYGYAARLVEADEIRTLEPNLRKMPELAVHASHEGGVAPDLLAQTLIRAAGELGAQIMTGVEALGLINGGVQTSLGPMFGDHVALALGAQTQAWLADQGQVLPMDNQAGMTLRTQPLPPLFNHILMTNDVHMNQLPDGSMIVGEIFSGASTFDQPAEFADAMLARMQAYLPIDTPRPHAQIIQAATRPVPADGLPVMGKLPGRTDVSVMTMHSGITLGPLVGSIMADLILKGTQDPALRAFSPNRFQ